MIEMINSAEMAVIAAVTIGVLQAVKDCNIAENRFMPIFGLFIGVLLCWLCSQAGLIEITGIYNIIWSGIIAGLTASGLFSGAKNLFEKRD